MAPLLAWERALTPKKYESDRTKGKLQEWISVGFTAQDRQTERSYVGAEIKTDPKSSLQFTPLLTVTEERFTLFLDRPTTNMHRSLPTLSALRSTQRNIVT